jgi:chromosome partitioning protein
VEALEQYPFPVLKSTISQRVVFAESAASGNTVLEVDKNGSAAKEVKALVNELLKLGVE